MPEIYGVLVNSYNKNAYIDGNIASYATLLDIRNSRGKSTFIVEGMASSAVVSGQLLQLTVNGEKKVVKVAYGKGKGKGFTTVFRAGHGAEILAILEKDGKPVGEIQQVAEYTLHLWIEEGVVPDLTEKVADWAYMYTISPALLENGFVSYNFTRRENFNSGVRYDFPKVVKSWLRAD